MLEKIHNSSSSDKYIQKMVKAIGDLCPQKLDYKRCGKKSSRLKMNMKRRHITFEEEGLIIRLHSLLGNSWSLIAKRIPGRSDHEIKSYWNSHHNERLNALSKRQRSAIKERESNRKIDPRESIEVSELPKTRGSSSELEDFGLCWIESELEDGISLQSLVSEKGHDFGHNESLVSPKEALLDKIYEEYEKLLN